jgi:hypothetical protein
MTAWLRRAFVRTLHEAWALFVDDFALAASAAGWVLIIALAVKLGLGSEIAGPLLFVGLAAALSLNVWRAPRRRG